MFNTTNLKLASFNAEMENNIEDQVKYMKFSTHCNVLLPNETKFMDIWKLCSLIFKLYVLEQAVRTEWRNRTE